MIACDLLSIDESIPPEAVNLSCSLLDAHIGRGIAVVNYVFKPSDIKTERTYHFSVATKFFSEEGECFAECEFCNVTLATKVADETREFPCCIASIPEAYSANSSAVLSKSSYSNSAYGDLVFRVEAQPGLTQLRFQLEFLLHLRGHFPTGSGDVWTTQCCNRWHQSTAVEYSLTCLLCYWAEASVKHADYFSGHCKATSSCESEPMSLTYTKKRGQRSSLNFDIVCSSPSTNAVPCVLGYAKCAEKVESYGMSVVLPPVLSLLQNADGYDVYPGEFIFLIDCSGSMSGINMLETAKSIHIALKSLPIGSYFNVIAFGSKFRNVFSASTEYSEDSLDQAFRFVSQMDTTLGGTDLLGPLQWLRKQPLQSGLSRQVFIITDGESIVPGDIVALIRPHASTTSCHLFGIGNQVSSLLLTQLAALTGGTVQVVEDLMELSALIVDALRRITSSRVVCDVSVSLELEGWRVLETYLQTGAVKASGGSAHYFVVEPHTDNHEGRSITAKGCVILTGRVQQDPVAISLPISASLTTYESVTAILPRIIGWRKLEKVLCMAHSKDRDLVVSSSKEVGLRSCYTEFVSKHAGCPVTPVPSVLVGKRRVSTQETAYNSFPCRKRPVAYSSYTIPGMVKAKLSSWLGSAVSVASTVLGIASSDREEDEGDLEYSLDDLESQQEATKGLHWGERGQLVLPSYYYKTPPAAVHPQSTLLEPGGTGSSEVDQLEEPSTSGCSCSRIVQPRDYIALVKLQHHDGTWSLNDSLFNSLGLDRQDVPFDKLFKILGKIRNKVDRDTTIATLVAVNAFHSLFKDSRRVWRLSVDKSCRWLHKHGLTMGQKESSECTRVLTHLYHDSKS